MKILSIEHNGYEQIGVNTTRHNGGGCFSRYAKELLNNQNDQFLVCGYAKSFDNIGENDNHKSLIILSDDKMDRLNSGEHIKNIIEDADTYDIIVHHRDQFAYNIEGLKAKQVYWSTFVNHTVHPKNHGALFYSYDQNPIVFNTTKCYKVKIGTYVPRTFIPTQKEDYIFICTRHDIVMDTNVILDLCIKNKIKCIVAGPILDNYPLRIDNQYTFYKGEISNEEKNSLSSKAFLYSCIQNWDTIFSISAIESLAFGTPIIARNRGCFTYIIKEGINGFFFDDNEDKFLQIVENVKKLNSEEVWKTSHEFSYIEMVKTFYVSFLDLLKS
jgi:glycosyltransferase involved in cell wall biosynthesis